MDEATPHLHMDYIPVAHGYKSGIYRIYGLKEDADNAKYYRMAGAIDDNYELKPTEYRAKR